MNWKEIEKPDGRKWRRPCWPVGRWITFGPSYVMIHWESKINGYDVTFYNPSNENQKAEDWEEL